jgi:hypothetical protein
MRDGAAFLIAIVAVFLHASGAGGATFVVNDQLDEAETVATLLDPICAAPGGSCTLRAAVQQANATPGPDEIRLPIGTYNLTIPPAAGGLGDAANGDLDVGGPLTIVGGDNVVIDGRGLGRIFEVLASGCLVLQSVTIQNGDASKETNTDACVGRGGGVCVQPTSATALGPCTAGELRLSNSTVKSSKATQGGAGLWNRGFLTLERSSVTDNNSTGNGGGIGSLGGTVTLSRSTVANNIGNQRGGGIALLDGAELTLVQSTVNNNTVAGRGGGISISDSPRATLKNATISGNTASETGGGLYASCAVAEPCTAGTGVVINSVTLAANRSSATEPTGGGIVRATIAPEIHLSNSILGDNIPDDCIGVLDSRGFNLIEDAPEDGCTIGGDTTGNQTCDPGLGALAKTQDEATATHPLLLASPAIDSGSPGDAGVSCEALDQLDRSRSGARCDIGAVEQPVDLCEIDFKSICMRHRSCNVDSDADDDGDGVENTGDCCAATAAGACVNKDGCTFLQRCPCDLRIEGFAWKSHKEWMKCVKKFRRSSRCPLPSLAEFAGCGVPAVTETDPDGDRLTVDDNCPDRFNPRQCNDDAAAETADKAPLRGNVCDADRDQDGKANQDDRCPNAPPADGSKHRDQDGDKAFDECDNCPKTFNRDQADIDGDGFGDACDRCRNLHTDDNSDTDNDGIGDDCDCCGDTPALPFGSVDCDGCAANDNCEPMCNHGACHDDFQSLRNQKCKPR